MNVMRQSEGVTIQIRSSVAASLIDMLNNDMLPEDTALINILNEGINSVCEDAKEYGVTDLRTRLEETIVTAKEIIEQKESRVKEGDSILNNINFNLN
jgi:predicted component of type VI protein secretion system